jgi:hypothetical protein
MSKEKHSELTPVHQPHPLVSVAETELEPQGKRAISGMIEVLKFYALASVLKSDAEAREKVFSQVEKKPKGGRPSKESDLGAIFAKHAPGLNLKSAHRLFDVGRSIADAYEDIVGVKVAKQIDLPALVITEPAKLPEPIRKKQQELFDYVSGTSRQSWLDKLRPPKPDARGHNPGGFRPNALYLRAWLETEYPDHPEYLENANCFSELPAEIQKRYKAEGKRYEERLTKEQIEELETAEAAREWNSGVPGTLNEALDHGLFDRATDDQLNTWEKALGDALSRVKQQLRDRAAMKKGKALK